MQKILFIILITILCVSVYSAPSILASSGGLHILTAIQKQGILSLSTHTGIATKDFPENYTLPNGNPAVAWDTYITNDMNFGMSYTFAKWLAISVKNQYKMDVIKHDKDASSRTDSSYISHGFGDTEIGIKLTTGGLFGSTDAADFGVYGFYRINSGKTPSASSYAASFTSFNYIKNDGGIFRYFTSNSRDYGAIGLISFKSSTQVPLEINLNGGYLYRKIIIGDESANKWIYGGDFLVHFDPFIPFIEVFGYKYSGSQFFEDRYIVYGTGGVRFDTPSGFVIDLAADIRMTNFSNEITPDTVLISGNPYYVSTGWGAYPDWKFYLGLSYCYDFNKEIPLPKKKIIKKTIITGKIIDAETGEPLSAEITLPGYSEEVSIVSDETGNYKIEVIPGTIRVKVKRSGYKWKEKGIIIEKGQTKILDFALNKKQIESGIITGKVSDKSTNEPVVATIKFPDTDIPDIHPDRETGIYRLQLAPGTYTIAAIADGYITWSQPVVIEANNTLILNIEMLKKGGKIELRGIYFSSGKANIKPESYPVLDQAVQMLKQNPRVKIEVQGHTDSVGSAVSNLSLSQARADAVRNYLIANGIDAWRIIAKGYGESMPIAENTTRDGRARNRRIEFLIIGE